MTSQRQNLVKNEKKKNQRDFFLEVFLALKELMGSNGVELKSKLGISIMALQRGKKEKAIRRLKETVMRKLFLGKVVESGDMVFE